MRSAYKETLKKLIVSTYRIFKQILIMFDTNLVARERRLSLFV